MYAPFFFLRTHNTSKLCITLCNNYSDMISQVKTIQGHQGKLLRRILGVRSPIPLAFPCSCLIPPPHSILHARSKSEFSRPWSQTDRPVVIPDSSNIRGYVDVSTIDVPGQKSDEFWFLALPNTLNFSVNCTFLVVVVVAVVSLRVPSQTAKL